MLSILRGATILLSSLVVTSVAAHGAKDTLTVDLPNDAASTDLINGCLQAVWGIPRAG